MLFLSGCMFDHYRFYLSLSIIDPYPLWFDFKLPNSARVEFIASYATVVCLFENSYNVNCFDLIIPYDARILTRTRIKMKIHSDKLRETMAAGCSCSFSSQHYRTKDP